MIREESNEAEIQRQLETRSREALVNDRKRIAGITSLQRQFPELLDNDTIERAINDDSVTIDSLQKKVLDEIGKNNVSREADATIGMSDKEIGSYSIVRALNQLASGNKLDGLEKEASDAVARKLGQTPQGFIVPPDAWKPVWAQRDGFNPNAVQRDLTAGTATAGGHTVATDLLAGSFIEILRNRAKVMSLGPTVLAGLSGDVAIPRQTTAGTAAQYAETGTISETNQAFNQLTLSPTRVGATTDYGKQLLIQSSLDVENFVRNDLAQAISLKMDAMALNGSGSSNEPTGLINTSGIGAVTFGGTATWADVVEFETDIATANADVDSMAFLTTAAVRGAWKNILEASAAGSEKLWPKDGMPNGYRAEVSEQVPSNKVLFGDWSQLILALFGGLDITVDPYTQATSGLHRITLQQFYDVGVRQTAAFSVSADAGNQ